MKYKDNVPAVVVLMLGKKNRGENEGALALARCEKITRKKGKAFIGSK